ncbi:hypothetical protein Salat_1110900 [Sesamum alatum]|uniref:Uncharacterized protein n=1 Tax=Sesamum alatum TaxID=300844 RepID=A0AAE1YPC4_9LAMI|nr:hypothetical protein Salat_1110900 [Sesamum alatum]
MLNDEIYPVHDLDTSNHVSPNIVGGDGVNAVNVVVGTGIDDAAVHDNVVHVNTQYVSNIPTAEDDFNYDDPIIAALLDKNWDEEIQARSNKNDIIADIEAINDILEMNAFRTPEKKRCTKTKNKGKSKKISNPATDENFWKTKTPKNTLNFQTGSTSHRIESDHSSLQEGDPNEQLEVNEPTLTFNRF